MGHLSKPCAFLVRQNANGERWAKQLNENHLDFTFIPGSPLDYADLESEHVWIVRQVALYLLNELYSEYDFYDEIPNSDAYKLNNIRKQLEVIQQKCNNDAEFHSSCIKLYEILGYIQDEQMKKEIDELFKVVNDDRYYATYNSEKQERVITTVHAAKGLEYKQVIVLAEDYNLNNEDDSFLHYVAVSRPEQRLLVLYNFRTNNGKTYWGKVKSNLKKLNDIGIDVKLENVVECKCSDEFRKV
ncbi:MAG: 3'-5' exonuclease [Bacteroidaceae bacterium]|nr:3'-5' exonuclease [Bacteroidaceae bacterium]